MLTLPSIKSQLNLAEDDNSEDALLTGYLAAAKRLVENRVNRPVNWSASDNPEAVAVGATEDICLAVLLLIGHFYANREATGEVALKNIPLGVSALLEPYQVINL